MAKRITQEQILGEKGVKLAGRRFLDMGFPWHPTNAPLDAGIDGFVELRDPSTGEASNSWIAVQSKARTRLEKESEQTFEFSCTARDLEYWRRGNMPVLLVVSRPDTDEAWWVAVKEYFRDPETHNSRRIVFDKAATRLGPDARLPLLSLAQAAGAGTYFRPSPKREHLHSNLLVTKRLPACIYLADAIQADPKELNRVLREHMRWPPREWFLHGGVVYSVHDLRDEPWVRVCDRGTIETIETEEWSQSPDPETQRLKADNVFYFKKSDDLSPRTRTYRSRKQTATRVVFKEYRSKKDPSKIAQNADPGSLRLA